MTSATTHDDFAEHWTRCARYIEPALGGTHSLGDVLTEIVEGRAMFWPGAKCALVTKLVAYPKYRALRIWLAGGDLDEIVSYLPAADNYAREHGCKTIEFEGRQGWTKVLNGYKTVRVVMTKDVD